MGKWSQCCVLKSCPSNNKMAKSWSVCLWATENLYLEYCSKNVVHIASAQTADIICSLCLKYFLKHELPEIALYFELNTFIKN